MKKEIHAAGERGAVAVSEEFDVSGEAAFKVACEHGLEGIVSKHLVKAKLHAIAVKTPAVSGLKVKGAVWCEPQLSAWRCRRARPMRQSSGSGTRTAIIGGTSPEPCQSKTTTVLSFGESERIPTSM